MRDNKHDTRIEQDAVRAKVLGDGFLEEVYSTPGGDTCRSCEQCGMCSASCPFVSWMDHPPRVMIQLTRAGMKETVLRSNSMWMCASCYLCTVRCPKGVEMTNFMLALRSLAERYRMSSRAVVTPQLDRAMMDSIRRNGRLFELGAMLHFYTRTNPLLAMRAVPVGLALLFRGRLPLRPKRIKGVRELAAIIQAAESGGTR
ncbi:MAG: 4Fe-4S dicluster domain-containing protein [Chloroflexota bacterium]|nr:4Fe-4S dicluster domain-containing protein [Chloroflexota bacterium]